MEGLLAISLFYSPIALFFLILYLLKKKKSKLLKYVIPSISLLIFIFYLFETQNFECDGYELNCFGNLGNAFMVYVSGIVFLISLIICTILDIFNYKTKKEQH